MARRHLYATCFVALLLALVALPAQAGGKHAFRPCKLLKKGEVAGAIGEPVKKSEGGKSSTGARFCNWYGDDTHVLSKGVSLIAARDHAKKRYREYKKLMSDPKPVNGIGDAAATDGEALIARKGRRRFVYLSPLYRGAGISEGALEPLAKKALKRLK